MNKFEIYSEIIERKLKDTKNKKVKYKMKKLSVGLVSLMIGWGIFLGFENSASAQEIAESENNAGVISSTENTIGKNNVTTSSTNEKEPITYRSAGDTDSNRAEDVNTAATDSSQDNSNSATISKKEDSGIESSPNSLSESTNVEKNTSSTKKVIYKNTNNPNLNNVRANGMEYYVQFRAKNKKTGEIEYSNKSWILTEKVLENMNVLLYGTWDLMNQDEYEDLELVARFMNNTDKNINLNVDIKLPSENNRREKNDDALVKGPVVINKGENTELTRVSYVTSNKDKGQIIYREGEENLSQITWEDLKKINLLGVLAPGEFVDLLAPLEYTDIESKGNDIKASLRFMDRVSGEGDSEITLRASRPIYDLDDMMYGRYAGAFRTTDENGKNTYKHVPKEIQEILPLVEKDDFIYSMFESLNGWGAANLDRESEDQAYPLSNYLIKTRRIFDAVKDHGYSVMADDKVGLWNSYAYNMRSGLVFTDSEGNRVNLGHQDENNILLSPYYVELHKIFETKDIEIFVNESWNEFDNLTYRKGIYSQNGTEWRDLTDDEIKVEHNVDNTKVGVYNVKYLYEVAKGEFVTITAKVTVKDRPVSPTKPVNPGRPGDNDEKPEKPVDPQKPIDPQKPVDPQKPADPQKPNNNDGNSNKTENNKKSEGINTVKKNTPSNIKKTTNPMDEKLIKTGSSSNNLNFIGVAGILGGAYMLTSERKKKKSK